MIDKRGENGPTQRGPRRVEAHRGWSPAAGLSGCSILPPHARPCPALGSGARTRPLPLSEHSGGGPVAAASGGDCGRDDPGPF